MKPIHISLLGRFQLRYEEQTVDGLHSHKAQELLTYLAIHRDRPHPREALASMLWGDCCTTAQAKKYLRKVLWQIQSAVGARSANEETSLLRADSDWVQINLDPVGHLDLQLLEDAYDAARGLDGGQLDKHTAERLQEATAAYAGDLLEGCYEDWCLCERERIQHVYLTLLDKLMSYCEEAHRYELGVDFGELILRHDRARERTHRQIMRLHYAAGDRTGALRQYARCEKALEDELDIRPSTLTTELYRTICRDGNPVRDEPRTHASEPTSSASVIERLDRIINLQQHLARLNAQLETEMESVEYLLQQRPI